MGKASILVAIAVLALVHGTGCTSITGSSAFSGRSLEEAIVFQPRAYPEGDWSPMPGVEDAYFHSSDGTPLHGWFAAAQQPNAVVLYLHGNGGNVTQCRDILRLYRDRLGATILAFDYRGYGRSRGTPTEEGVLADARAARRWLANRTGVREEEIVLVGHSLGGGIAVDLAAKDGAGALVLENTFTSLSDVATSHFPLLPFRHLMTTRLNSLGQIQKYRGPLLVKHGEDDETVPYSLGKKLFEAANEPKRFISIPGGRHNDLPTREYLTALREFLGPEAGRE